VRVLRGDSEIRKPDQIARLSIHTIHSVLHSGKHVPEDLVGNDLGFGRGYVSVADGAADDGDGAASGRRPDQRRAKQVGRVGVF